MKQKGDAQLAIALILIAVLLVAGYFAYKNYGSKLTNVLPSPLKTVPSSNVDVENLPVIIEPKAGSRIASPVKIRGTVPPGWMFEGVFPIKLVDANRNVIVQGSATEEVPGAWQSNATEYFTVTLSFSTQAKSGFIILENDNPSGDPAKSKTFEVPVTF